MATGAGARAGPRLHGLIARGLDLASVPFLAAVPPLARSLPRRWALGLGRWAAWPGRAGRKRQILAALETVLGPASGPARDRAAFWNAHLTHVGCTIMEVFVLSAMPNDEVLRRVTIEGQEHLRAALDRGRGAVLFLNHFGNPGATVAGLGLRGYDLTIAGNRMEASVLGVRVPLHHAEAAVQRMFRDVGIERALLGEELPRRAARSLARNGLFAMFIDFPVVRRHNRWLPFGAGVMNVNLGPALLALRHEAPVLCLESIRAGDNHHRLVVHPPLDRPTAADRREAAGLLIEQALRPLAARLRQHPEQWWPWDWAEIAPASEG